MGHLLSSVYKDLHSYETMPKRREPYTLQMHSVAAQEAATRRESSSSTVVTLTLRTLFVASQSASYLISTASTT